MPNPGGSRRDRPAKPALSLQWIVAETIAIIRAEGLERATMRRVAQALDTGPASLYVYVANTAELHAAVLDELIASIEPKPGDWLARLESVLDAYAEVLFTYPGLARSALVLRPTGPHAVRLYDRVLGLLLEGGVAVQRAAWGVDLLLQHVTATAAEHSAAAPNEVDAPPDGAAQMDTLRRALRGADAAESPHVVAHADALLAGTPAQRQAWAIRALVQGIATTPTES
ncbi:TetR/AcrR family transcriptional regulator [Cellulomonas sp. URHD0024]|uniref:TetR/AcrR family transcriptional regulator n=1 Tax=Cellulomonas sp. URHD0024 TaxID=1302620 RepID=UPI0004175EB5|nr:TetR/AcrR family transcriptional regulator [Cellulomonas sp. URHD0024]